MPTNGKAHLLNVCPGPIKRQEFPRIGLSGFATSTWPAEVGASYRVQFKTALDVAAWADLGNRIVATNKTGSFVDSTIVGVPQRFYRVVRLP